MNPPQRQEPVPLPVPEIPTPEAPVPEVPAPEAPAPEAHALIEASTDLGKVVLTP